MRLDDKLQRRVQVGGVQDGLVIVLASHGEPLGVLHHVRVEAEAEAGVRDLVLDRDRDGTWTVEALSDLGAIFVSMLKEEV